MGRAQDMSERGGTAVSAGSADAAGSADEKSLVDAGRGMPRGVSVLASTPPPAQGPSIASRWIWRPAFDEGYLTARPPAGQGTKATASAVFRGLAETISRRGIDSLQEKVYGLAAHRDELLTLRAEALETAGLDPSLPCTFVDGRPPRGAMFGGVQLWGVVGRAGAGVRVETVEADGGVRGRLLQAPGLHLLHLFGVRGTAAGGALASGVTEQGARMFQNAETALGSHGFGFEDVARTWIYVRRILDWYGELNRVRTAFFKERGIGRPGGRGTFFPASTGIQGRSGDEECLMDVLAIQADPGSDVRVAPTLSTSRQDRPFEYGSAFSRGVSLATGGRETILVSGTASIDQAGRTCYLEAPDGQILETLLSLAAVLEPHGAGLADICSATVFCKEPQILDAFERVTRLLGVPRFPFIPVVADVCRPELLVEIEAVAAPPAPSPSELCREEEVS